MRISFSRRRRSLGALELIIVGCVVASEQVACVSALWIDASWDLRTTVSSVDCRIEGSEQIFLNSRSSLGP